MLFDAAAFCASLVGRACSAANAARLFPGEPTAVCHWTAEIKYPERIRLGRHVVIGPGCVLGAHGGISLGDHVHVSKDVMIETAGLDFGAPPPFPHVSKPISIGAGTWIGARAIVLGGVTIGENCVIGANAVVAKDLPAGSRFVGATGRLLD